LVPGGGELVPASIATIQLAQELLQWAAAVLVPAVVVPAATVVIVVVSVAVVVPATAVVVVVVTVAVVVPAAAVVVSTAVVAIAIVVPAATVVVSTTIVVITVVVPAATVVVSTSIQQSLALVAVELRSAACVVTVDFSLELLGRPSVPARRADWRGGLDSCPAVPAAVAAAVGANQTLDILQVAPPLA